MKLAVFLLAAGLCSAASGADFAPVPKHLQHCTAPAAARLDNDIEILDGAPRGPLAPMPEAVAQAIEPATDWVTRPIRNIANGQREAIAKELAKTRCRDVYPFANIVPLKNGRSLYAVHAKSAFAHWLLLVVYDPATGKATPKPASVNLRWTGPKDPLMKRPYISFTDLRGDGHEQVVVEERGHNGTLYNAAVYRYFDLTDDLVLTNVLALEARAADPDPRDEAVIERTLTSVDATHVRIDQVYVSGKNRISGGYAVLESAGRGKPYRVRERHGITTRAAPHFQLGNDSLITLSGVDDDQFLKDGHGLYY